MTSPSKRRAHVVGLGLIGSSVALALSESGWAVTGTDRDPLIVETALEEGVIAGVDLDDDVDLVVIATPAGVVADTANDILSHSSKSTLIVTDVAGVKSAIVGDVADPRFLAGHPMAGSELRGLAGARPDLFRECTWVLTPTSATKPETYTALHGVLRELGANVVAVDADDHDRLVAVASHVPHLLAGALMNEASRVAEQDAVLLQLAAGGFRDMTRVAAGHPGIWPDICALKVMHAPTPAMIHSRTAPAIRPSARRRRPGSGDPDAQMIAKAPAQARTRTRSWPTQTVIAAASRCGA